LKRSTRGEEPWKREWWAIIEQNIGDITTVGSSWDVEKARRNREGDEQRRRERDAHEEAEIRKYYTEGPGARPGGT
jgi:hypothetical protein